MSEMDYDFPAKQAGYRVPAWGFVDRLSTTPRRLRRVAILDTKQGLEVRHLIRLGYTPENILVVNYNAAELAVMTRGLRSDGIEGVRTKAGEFVNVLMAWDGPLHVIAFDTTSNLASKSFVSLAEVIEKHLPECLVSVMLAGREGRETCRSIAELSDSLTRRRDSLNRDVNPNHFARVTALLGSLVMPRESGGNCILHVPEFRWSTYMSSSGQPMAWVCARVVAHRRDKKPARSIFAHCVNPIREARNLLMDLHELEGIRREERVLQTEREEILAMLRTVTVAGHPR